MVCVARSFFMGFPFCREARLHLGLAESLALIQAMVLVRGGDEIVLGAGESLAQMKTAAGSCEVRWQPRIRRRQGCGEG